MIPYKVWFPVSQLFPASVFWKTVQLFGLATAQYNYLAPTEGACGIRLQLGRRYWASFNAVGAVYAVHHEERRCAYVSFLTGGLFITMDLHRCAGSAEIFHLTHNNEAKSEIYSCMLLPANEELISVLLIALWNISGRIITAVQKSSQTMLSHGMFGVNLEANILCRTYDCTVYLHNNFLKIFTNI